MTAPRQRRTRETGSAMVMAMFVLSLLTGMGIALLVVTEIEMRMHQADLRSKVVFYLAEAGLEDGRETLRQANNASANLGSLDDELLDAAGPNGRIDLDLDTLSVLYDADGQPVDFTGYGDDVPVRATTRLGDGIYAAFLTNDAVDGLADLDDTNDRVQVVSIAAGPGRSRRIVQGIIERHGVPEFPAAITILGPLPDFDGGSGDAKLLTGDDCNGAGVPGLSVPVAGVIGAAAEAEAELHIAFPDRFRQGIERGPDTVDDITGIIDPAWLDCNYLKSLALEVRDLADVVGDSSTPKASLGTVADPKIVYIEGDYDINVDVDGGGVLWITGDLHATSEFSWTGVVFVVGTGQFWRQMAAERGSYSGAFLVANIAGPDGVMWTADDCSGSDGVLGNADDPFGPGMWHISSFNRGTTEYCTASIADALDLFPFVTTEFRQR